MVMAQVIGERLILLFSQGVTLTLELASSKQEVAVSGPRVSGS